MANLNTPFELFLYDSLQEYRKTIENGIISKVMWIEAVKKAHDSWHAFRKIKRRKPIVDDGEWIESLKVDPALQGVDVMTEIAKCRFWCRSQPTPFVASRQRIVNWLNKADRKVSDQRHYPPMQSPPEPSWFKEWFQRTRETPPPVWSTLDDFQQGYLVNDHEKNP